MPRPTELPPVAGDLPEISAETVRTVIRARRLRARYFDEDMFADPAWDMLLDLLQAEIAQLRVPVSSLCIAAAVPATTALRWLKTMTQQGIFVRRADPNDGRRVFVELAPQASLALRRYFADAGKPVVVCGCGGCNFEAWWALTGSNRRPSRCKRDALPAELSALMCRPCHDRRERATVRRSDLPARS